MATTTPSPTPKPHIDASAAARLAVDVASDRQAEDIVLLDVHEISSFADYMVLMSAGSVRQANALASELEAAIERAGLDMHHREGTGDSGWVLLDFGDLVLHVFGQEQREFYQLQQVWKAAKQVVRIQ
jgi:ribosome-associated protein